jgi:hypothetical protein
LDCAYYGWRGRGNIRAHGPPGGTPWRQLQCGSCLGYFQQLQGTPLPGKHVAIDKRGWAVGALAAGLGIRAVARGVGVDPHTVLAGWGDVAEHATAWARYFLRAVPGTQGQWDELCALLSAGKAGEVSAAEAIQRLARSPHWGWGALDPVTTLRRTIDVGDRTLAMAQRVVHQVVQGGAPGCVPLWLTDGLKASATACLTHLGQGVQPPRRRASGPAAKPRWRPLPQLLSAQGVKTVRRQRLGATCSTASSSVPSGQSSRCWRDMAGRATRPASRASP